MAIMLAERMARAIADHAEMLAGHRQVRDIVNWVEGRSPQGHVSMWNNSLAMHRRSDWLVSCRGMGPWVPSMEIYSWTEGNNYANLIPYGSMLFARNSGESHSTRELEPGWNWNYMPGATSRVLPQHRRFAPGTLACGSNTIPRRPTAPTATPC